MATLVQNANDVASCATAIDAAIVAKGGTLVGGGKLRNAAAGIAAIPSGDTWPKTWIGSGSHIWLVFDSQCVDRNIEMSLFVTVATGYEKARIVWGDGSVTEVNSGRQYGLTHEYASDGNYRIDIEQASSSFIYSFKHTVCGKYNGSPAVRQYESDYETISWSADAASNMGTCINLVALKFTNATTINNFASYLPKLKWFYAPNATSIAWGFGSVTDLGGAFEVPSTLTSAGAGYLAGCYGIKSLTVPVVTTWGGAGIYNLSELKTINFGSATSIPSEMLRDCIGLLEVVVPSSITTTNGAFMYRCASATKVDLPSGWTGTNSAYAFNYMPNLTTLIVRATTPPTLSGNNNFSATPSTIKVYVPQGCISAYEAANIWSKFADHYYELDADGNIPT